MNPSKESQIRAYYSFLYDWYSKNSLQMLDRMTQTLQAMSRNKVIKEQKLNVKNYKDELTSTKYLIQNMPAPENASVKEIINICNEIIQGKLIWSSNIGDEKNITMGNYAKYIIELV